MAYNKHQKLNDNIEAIRIALEVERDGRSTTAEELAVLRKYSGFGGLKFILNPVYDINLQDDSVWKSGDRPFLNDTIRLHELLQQFSKNDKEYQAYVDSLKRSVTTAFYTPDAVVKAISKTLVQSGIAVNKFLDPSSGNGKFIDAFKVDQPDMEVSAFEKDLLTGKILKALHPEDQVIVNGFETIPQEVLGSFDLVTSNIPFGDIKVFDPAMQDSDIRKFASNTLHNYFFLKALDAVHDGGLVAFITSRGVMDSRSYTAVRMEMLRHANVVSAVRLPDGMFSEEAGTEAGSDLIILQKDMSKDFNVLKDDDVRFINSVESSDGIHANRLFLSDDSHIDSSHILAENVVVGKNMYGDEAYEYQFIGDSLQVAHRLEEVLAADLSENLDVNLYNKNIYQVEKAKSQAAIQKSEQKPAVGPVQLDLFAMWDVEEEQKNASEPRSYQGSILSHWRDGVIIADDDKLGVLSGVKAGHPIFTPLTDNQLSPRDYPLMRQYITVRDLYNDLYNTEAAEKVEQADLRKQLNEAYDRFRQQYGALNERKIQRLLLLDPLSRDMLCVENVVDGEFVKADIFSRPVSFLTYEIEHVDTPEEALHLSMNRYGRVNLGYMEDITGIGKDELIAVLKGQMYYMPDGHYHIAAKVLSGNIYEKIDDMDSAIRERSNHSDESDRKYDVVGKLEETKAALISVLPTQIAFDDIGLQFGERWIPNEYYEEYISKLFDTDIEIHYAEHIDEYSLKADNRYNLKIREEYCIHGEYKDYDGMALLQHAFHDTTPDIQKCVGYNDKGEDVKAPDMEKIQLANSKIQEIRNGFAEYLTNLPQEQRDELQEMYNRKFNCFVKAKYDGDYQTFPGIDLKALAAPKFNVKNIYKSQKDCVSMIVQNGGGICDHEVGTGKTLIMCMAAHEMHRLGIANKPMIIALKANVSEIAATYQAAFPDDKILYASEKDFSPANRVQFFNRIKNNDYACVIMSHDQFCKIPQSMEIQEQILSDEICDLDEALDVLRLEGHSISKRMLSGLEKRKENLSAKLHQMQFDINKRTDDVVDFGTMGIDHIFVDESHQFKNLMFTTRHQRVSGLGNPAGSQKATNLLYAIRTIQERTGKDLGATFLSGTTISNSLTELYLLFKYLRPQAMAKQGIHSFDAWAAVYAKKTTDYEFNVTNQIAAKERYRYFVKVPELATFYNEITDYRTGEDVGLDRPAMNVILHNIAPTADQQDFNQRLVEFAKSGDGELIFREPLNEREEKGKMLIATDASRKAALDMRLVSQELFSDDPDNKASHCAKLVAEYYQRYNEQKGTQFIFSDLSTYKPGEWNVFSEIKRKLVEDYSIPEQEIRFIQEAKNENQRKQIIQDMNDGKIRVLFGSTSTLGTGVNAQNRAVAVHHIDIPWRPSDLEQRNGRARRTGNWLAKEFAGNQVDVIVYAVERSLDSYKFNLLQNKQLFITQLKTNQLGSRVIDEGSLDEQNGMNFGEYVAILSGNDDLLQKEKLKNKVLALESERKTYMMARRDTEWRLGNAREKLEKNDVIIRQMTEDYNSFQSLVQRREDGSALPGLVMPKEPEFAADGSYNVEGMGSILQDAGRTVGNKDRQLGTVYGFPLFVDSTYVWDDKAMKNVFSGNRFYLQGHYMYEYNNGKIAMSKDNRLAAVSYGVNALEKIPGYIKQYEERNESLHKNIAEYERIAGKAWPKEQELLDLKQQMEELDKKIQASLDETNASLPKQEEPVYKISREGKNHKVVFAREALSLVSFMEMREAADTGSWRNRGYVSGYEWCGNHLVSDSKTEAEFSLRQKAEEFIKEMMDLQKSRQDDMQWLEAKAAEDTDGYLIHQDNEVIFAARKRLAELNNEEYHLILPDDVRQQLFDVANKIDFNSDCYSDEHVMATEARKTLNDYGIDWHTNLSLDAVGHIVEKWESVSYDDLSEQVNAVINRLDDKNQSMILDEERDFLNMLSRSSEKRFQHREDRREALQRLGIYTEFLCSVVEARETNELNMNSGEEQETVDIQHLPVNAGLSAIVEQRHLDTDEVFIQNHSEIERQSLRYRTGERYEDYLVRNNLSGNVNDSKLYFHDKYTSSQWKEVNDLFAQIVDKDSAVTVGRKVAELSFVDNLKEGQALFDLQRSINTETILPYLDGLHEAMNNREESPMMKQFHDLKAKHPDAMLLFRCGDFYETYEEDANTAAKVLGIALTWRKNHSADFTTFKGAMAGFPHHALDTHLPKLIRAGLRVAICDQLEAPQQTVKRGITELVSSGVKMQVIDRVSSLLPAEKTLMSQIVMDLETGNHLLGRPRSKEYWDFAAEHGGAVRALKEGTKLTDRQRDILLERAYNYNGGIAELAAMLNMDEQQIRKALIYDAVQEHRIEQQFHVFEDGLFVYVDARHGFGLSPDFVEKVAQVHYGERTERDGRLMYRFPLRDDASNFVHNIGILNERYTNSLRDSLIEKMRKSGIDVNTNWEEGERVLAQENGRVRSSVGRDIVSPELRIINDSFNSMLSVLTPENANNLAFQLGIPNSVMKDGGVQDKPLKLYGNKIIAKQRKHGFGFEELRNLPIAVANPIAIFNNYKNEYNRSILTELRTKNGNFLVSVEVGDGVDLDFNIVSSVFGKGDISIVDWLKKGYATYINNEKVQNFLSYHSALIAGASAKSEPLSAAKIRENFELSKLLGEKLYIRTKNFRNWFGDWEKDEQPSSKIVSDNGEPMVFYHGTNRDFSEFDPEKSAGMMMFTSDEALARKFAAQRYKFDRDGNLVKNYNGEPVKGDIVMPVYLNVRNPKVIDMDGYDWFGNGVGDNAGKSINKGRKTNFSYLEAKKAQKEGYDGLVLKDVTDGKVKSDHVIVFNANQIKSVQNVGTYRLDSNNIYEHRVIDNFDALSQEERLAELRSLSDEQLDVLYISAMPDNKEVMRDVLNVMAERRGYTLGSSYQGTSAFNGAAPSKNAYFETAEERKRAWENGEYNGNMSLADYIDSGIDTNDLEWQLTDRGEYRRTDAMRRECIDGLRQAVNGGTGTVKMYRSVPSFVEEGQFRNGDWITPSKSYAIENAAIHGWGDNFRIIEQDVPVGHVRWNGDDIAEWGYDDGKDYRYKNTQNNDKLNDLITYDDQGNVILPSKRFDDRTADIRYMLVPDSHSPIFISNALLALNKIKQEKATPEQWLNMLQKNGGIKAGEDRWIGLSQWLMHSQEKVLTKDAISAFLSENMIQVEEVHYVDPASLEDSEEFRNYQKEFDSIKEHIDELYSEADSKHREFVDEMKAKYGSTWHSQLTSEEHRLFVYLRKNRDSYLADEERSEDNIAYDEMISRHGDDWGMAFNEGGGRLFISDEQRAVDFLAGSSSMERAINSTRLRFTTDELINKREIVLTVPTIESWNSNDDIHFGDADDGRAIAWVRFGDAISKRPLTEQEKVEELSKLPTADQWQKVDGGNKYDNYYAPGENRFNYDVMFFNEDGRFYGELNSSSRISVQPFLSGYDSLEEAVNAYNRWKVNKMTKDEKILVIDEIQSKRHQEGREKGYKGKEVSKLNSDRTKALEAKAAYGRILRDKYGNDFVQKEWTKEEVDKFNLLQSDIDRANEALSEYEEKNGYSYNKIPDAPFEKNWQELAMKRMLRYAAENGYDRVAWLNGKQQADRYDLGKVVERITVNAPDENGKREVTLQPVEDSSGHIGMMYFSVDKDGIVYSNSNPDWIERHVSDVVGKPLADNIMSVQEFTVFEYDDLRVGIYGMKAFYDEMLPNFMNKYGKQWGVHVEDMDIPALQRENSSDGVSLHGFKITEQMKQDVLQGQPMFFRSGVHQAYGFVHNGTIYIDPRIATAETPLHEYAHLWAEVLRQRNPQEWQNIVQMMKDTPEVWNYVKQNYPHLKTDDQIADEALAQFSGKRGYQKLQEFVNGQEDKSILDKMMEVLGKFWSHVAEFFGIHYTNKEEVADRILYDLLNEVNPLDYHITADKTFYENFFREQQEKQIESDNFKNWFGYWQVAVNPYSSRITIGSPVADYDTVDVGGAGCMYPILLDGERIGWIPTAEYFDFKKKDLDMSSVFDGFVNINSFGNNVEIEPEYRGNGYGKAAYFELARLMAAKGFTLRSAIDSSRSDSANYVWEALEKDGLAHKEGDRYVFDREIFRSVSKVIDEDGRPLVVEHATNADFTVFDPRHIGENSKDNGLFGAGFYFGTHAPGWMQGSKNVMKVYLNIRNPFEVNDAVISDIYSEIVEKMDTPAMRGLTITGLNGKQMQVGEYIDVIKSVDDLIKHNPVHVNEQIEHDEELQSYHPKDRLNVWREHEISRLTGLGVLGSSWKCVIADYIGSYQFTEAAKKDGYDGVIADKGDGYKEYVAFESTQIKSATENVGLFNKDNPDIRFHFIGEQGALNLDKTTGSNAINMLQQAKMLHEAGASAKDIKIVTGWERGADDLWRYEITAIKDFNIRGNVEWLSRHPELTRYLDLLHKENAYAFGIDGAQPLTSDEQKEIDALRKMDVVRYYNPRHTMKNPDSLTLKDYMDAPQLYAAYPELKDMKVTLADLPAGNGGSLVTSEDWLGENVSEYIRINKESMRLARDLYSVSVRRSC